MIQTTWRQSCATLPADTWFLPPAVCGFFLLLIPAWVLIARHSPPIREVLKSGWHPVILAMTISRWADLWPQTLDLHRVFSNRLCHFHSLAAFLVLSLGGLILDKALSDPNYDGMAVFTPVINGEWGIELHRLISPACKIVNQSLWIFEVVICK